MRVALARELRGDERALRVADALGHRHDAAAELRDARLDVRREARDRERALGKVHEVRAVVRPLARERGGRREEARVAPHHDVDLHAAERAVVEVVAAEGARDETRGRAVAGRVVVHQEVAVDRLRNVDDLQRRSGRGGALGDDARGVGGVVAADVEEVADAAREERGEDPVAVLLGGLVAAGAERGGRRRGDRLELRRRETAQVEEVALEDAVDAVAGAEDAAHGGTGGLRREDDAGERLVDDHGGAARLGDGEIAERFHGGAFYPRPPRKASAPRARGRARNPLDFPAVLW